ncbi:MAG: glycosyltransferase family 39 protein, partial [Actinomycetota bacterium]|nr:glycosyltransferase family 39 protein [Actinomycetota bacterium]
MPRAIGLFGHDLNPHYFVNPPALTYLLHVVFAAWFGGGEGTGRAFAADPGQVFLVARVTVALISTAAVGLIYVAGARLLDRRVGFVAAIVLAVAFLPVFYAHLALNDAVALAPAALALVGAAGVLRDGRARDYALAGIGLGLACSAKYTAGIVVLPIVAAAALAPVAPRRAARGLALAVAVALAAAVAANPYAVLDAPAFVSGLRHQAAASGVGKLGLSEGGGHRYYLWTLTWGLGLAPTLAALGGACWLAVRRRRVAALLIPAPVVFMLYMGAQDRYFGRWLLPVIPLLCLLAAAGAVAFVDALGRRRGVPRVPALAVAALALAAQGLLFSLHD